MTNCKIISESFDQQAENEALPSHFVYTFLVTWCLNNKVLKTEQWVKVRFAIAWKKLKQT